MAINLQIAPFDLQIAPSLDLFHVEHSSPFLLVVVLNSCPPRPGVVPARCPLGAAAPQSDRVAFFQSALSALLRSISVSITKTSETCWVPS